MAKKTQSATLNPKLVVLILLFVAFALGYTIARAKYKPQIIELSQMVQEKAKEADEVKTSANKVMMKDGKVWLVEKGIANELSADLMLSNGDKVMMDGMIVKSDGTEMMMEEGQTIDMQGETVDE